MKIKLHSITDLVTNSSTTIYTYSDQSLEAMRTLVDEFFKAFGIDKKCNDVFTLTLTFEDSYGYKSRLDYDNLPKELQGPSHLKQSQAIDNILERVFNGEIEKPQWMLDIENDGFRPSTTLKIVAKHEKHAKLAELFHSFLYSTESEEGEC